MTSSSPRGVRALAPDLALALEASDIGAFVTAVDAHLTRSDEEGAREALWLGLERWPSDERVARRLADALHRTGDARGMRRFARAVLARRLSAPDLHFVLGAWAESHGQRGAAARSFARAARGDATDPEPVVRLVRTLRQAGRLDLAQRTLKRALERLPQAADLHAAHGYVLVDARRPTAAVEAFREAVRLEPDWPTYREDLAGALVLAERWREAAAEAQAAVKAAPQSERGWTALAFSFARLGQREVADSAFRKALSLAADPARAQGNYGLFLRHDPLRVMEAGRLLRAALDAHSDWDEVRAALAGLAG